MTWQPIETAPKDGQEVLLYGKHGWPADDESENETGIVVGYYGLDKWVTKTDNPYQDVVYPTHWMPLPDAP